jgi:NhaP-type Na+/H+ and K+/H+ antiporter
MKRETLLEKGFTEEQVTTILNMFHANVDSEKKLEEQLEALQTQLADYEVTKTKLSELEREKMSADEKIEADKKETAKNLAESRIIKNQAKVEKILSEVGITDENRIKALVSDDEALCVATATQIANSFKALKENTIKETTANLQAKDVKPAGSNVKSNGDDSSTITNKEQFTELLKKDYTKAKAWKDSNPELYSEIMK